MDSIIKIRGTILESCQTMFSNISMVAQRITFKLGHRYTVRFIRKAIYLKSCFTA